MRRTTTMTMMDRFPSDAAGVPPGWTRCGTMGLVRPCGPLLEWRGGQECGRSGTVAISLTMAPGSAAFAGMIRAPRIEGMGLLGTLAEVGHVHGSGLLDLVTAALADGAPGIEDGPGAIAARGFGYRHSVRDWRGEDVACHSLRLSRRRYLYLKVSASMVDLDHEVDGIEGCTNLLALDAVRVPAVPGDHPAQPVADDMAMVLPDAGKRLAIAMRVAALLVDGWKPSLPKMKRRVLEAA